MFYPGRPMHAVMILQYKNLQSLGRAEEVRSAPLPRFAPATPPGARSMTRASKLRCARRKVRWSREPFSRSRNALAPMRVGVPSNERDEVMVGEFSCATRRDAISALLRAAALLGLGPAVAAGEPGPALTEVENELTALERMRAEAFANGDLDFVDRNDCR